MGGLRIEHPAGLAAHSDGDVVLHALTDAIFGALADGDIGEHFPDSDPQYRDADSAIFLRAASRQAAEAGYRIENCDITILAEAPRLGPHKRPMAERIAQLLGVEPARVSVKAKTAEGMGLVGAGEGIACFATVLLSSVATRAATPPPTRAPVPPLPPPWERDDEPPDPNGIGPEDADLFDPTMVDQDSLADDTDEDAPR
jgi:2-C-methyl-D-erythritol 2,4-cyclodiphosphate synthase